MFLLATLHDDIAGGLMVYRLGNRMSAEAIAENIQHKEKGTTFFLFWEAIKLAKRLGCTHLDFGRTSVDNQGLMTFKSRWGTHVMDLPQFYWWNGRGPRNHPVVASHMDHLRSLCSRLPTPLFSALGDLCYRHMG